MSLASKKIELQRYRDFGDTINVGVEFARQNLKPLLRSIVMVGGPVFLGGFLLMMLGIGMAASFITLENMPIAIIGGILTTIGLVILFAGALMLTIAIYEYIILYIKREDFTQITVADVRKNVYDKIGRYLVMGFVVFLFFAITFIPSIFALFIPLVYCWVPLAMVFILLSWEGISPVDAFKRCFAIIKNKWWETFAIFFVVQMILSTLSYAFQLPVFIVPAIFGAILGETTALILTGVLYSIAMVMSMFLSSFSAIIYAIRYFGLLEFQEGNKIKNRIDQIGQTKDTSLDKPDYTEEY